MVNLLTNGAIIQSTTTDADGYYQFTVSQTAPMYRVNVVLPAGYAATARFAGPADMDSNVDGLGNSEYFSLPYGESDLTIDAGLVSSIPGAVGDYVWLDDNSNGIQDVGEAGFPNVTVNLYDVASSLVATTTTDANGYYEFTGLAPNTYYLLEFIGPEGYEFTAPYAASPDLDSDADPYGFADWFWVVAGTTNLTIDAGLEPAAAPAEPVIEIRKVGDNKVDKLRVAKWENAFERSGDTILIKNDFIRLDPDRFYVYVIHAAANTNPAVKDTIKVKVSTTSDAGNDIVLEETDVNTGRFWSKDWLLLTSVQVDDDYKVNGIADNTEGDPTFLVKLGDTITATYGTRTATATVPVEKIVKLHINILRDKKMADGGKEVIERAAVERLVRLTTEIYAPVGIRFDPTIQIVDPPQGVDLSDGLLEEDTLSNEAKALLGAAALRTAGKDDIEVYWVNRLSRGNHGFSTIASQFDEKYVDCIVIQVGSVYHTLAHEAAHILMDEPEHVDGRIGTNRVNLMAVPYRQVLERALDRRRISAAQAKAMLSKRPNLLTNP